MSYLLNFPNMILQGFYILLGPRCFRKKGSGWWQKDWGDTRLAFSLRLCYYCMASHRDAQRWFLPLDSSIEIGIHTTEACTYDYTHLSSSRFSQPFVVETDASTHGIGAVLSQHGHPLAYFSKMLSPRMSKACAYVHELYAITEAVPCWHHYLLGKCFTTKTDHQSLKESMS